MIGKSSEKAFVWKTLMITFKASIISFFLSRKLLKAQLSSLSRSELSFNFIHITLMLQMLWEAFKYKIKLYMFLIESFFKLK